MLDLRTWVTLRAVAREAGVSHAAPTHHFGDLTGLEAREDRLPLGDERRVGLAHELA